MPVTQTTSNTQYFSSPITSSAYVMAIPNPLKPATGGLFAGLDQPQFFYSQTGNQAYSLTDGAFISTCDWILKHYTAAGAVNSASPAAPAGCSTVGNCQSAFTSAGWFQSYGFVAPA